MIRFCRLSICFLRISIILLLLLDRFDKWHHKFCIPQAIHIIIIFGFVHTAEIVTCAVGLLFYFLCNKS